MSEERPYYITNMNTPRVFDGSGPVRNYDHFPDPIASVVMMPAGPEKQNAARNLLAEVNYDMTNPYWKGDQSWVNGMLEINRIATGENS
jgi:hypothetical protein